MEPRSERRAFRLWQDCACALGTRILSILELRQRKIMALYLYMSHRNKRMHHQLRHLDIESSQILKMGNFVFIVQTVLLCALESKASDLRK